MPAIFSTASADTVYILYASRNVNEVPAIKAKVTIKGKANVAVQIKRGDTDRQDHTPVGVKTVVSDQELELLRANLSFQRHVEKGFLVIDRESAKIPSVVKNMEGKDNAAPITSTTKDERVKSRIKAEHLDEEARIKAGM